MILTKEKCERMNRQIIEQNLQLMTTPGIGMLEILTNESFGGNSGAEGSSRSVNFLYSPRNGTICCFYTGKEPDRRQWDGQRFAEAAYGLFRFQLQWDGKLQLDAEFKEGIIECFIDPTTKEAQDNLQETVHCYNLQKSWEKPVQYFSIADLLGRVPEELKHRTE